MNDKVLIILDQKHSQIENIERKYTMSFKKVDQGKLSADNLINYESNLDKIQRTIEKEEKLYNHWDEYQKNKKDVVRNKAATMNIHVNLNDKIKLLEKCKLSSVYVIANYFVTFVRF